MFAFVECFLGCRANRSGRRLKGCKDELGVQFTQHIISYVEYICVLESVAESFKCIYVAACNINKWVCIKLAGQVL